MTRETLTDLVSGRTNTLSDKTVNEKRLDILAKDYERLTKHLRNLNRVEPTERNIDKLFPHEFLFLVANSKSRLDYAN